MILACHAHFIILYESAIRLEMKDAFFGCHESYRSPFPSTSPPYFFRVYVLRSREKDTVVRVVRANQVV